PLDGWTFMRYDMNDHVGGNQLADYPKFGYNADGWFASFNMFTNGSSFSHVDTLAISKADLSGTRYVVPGGPNFPRAPANIRDPPPGGAGGLGGRAPPPPPGVFQTPNVPAPPVQVATITVPSYTNPPNARQLGGPNPVPTIDNRIMNATMIYGQLL